MWNSGWDDIFRKHEWGKYPPEEVIRLIARHLFKVPDRKVVRILEIGCGTGANLWFVAREGFDAYGLDGSQVAIERARERLKDESLSANLVLGDAMNLPYAENFFDVVLDIECSYANSLKDTKVIMNEVHRVLKPGGLFLNKTFMVGTYGDGKGKKLEGEPHTYLELDEGALKKGYGIIRFTAENEISGIFSNFKIESIEYLIRSEQNRKYEIKEWLITSRKPACA